MYFQKPPLGTTLDWEHPFNKDLALHLAMNEGHGDVVRDLSMNGNHGTLKNMAFPSTPVSGWNPGKTGAGLNFDGDNDYVDCGNNASLDIVDAITLSTWIKIYSIPSNYPVIVAKFTYNSAWGLFIEQAAGVYGGKLQFRWYDGGANRTALSSGNSLNTWYHVVGTHDGTTGKIYIDGVLKDVQTFPFSPGTGTDITIGGYSASAFLNATIDQVRIHTRAQTAKEVQGYHINPWQVYLDEEDM